MTKIEELKGYISRLKIDSFEGWELTEVRGYCTALYSIEEFIKRLDTEKEKEGLSVADIRNEFNNNLKVSNMKEENKKPDFRLGDTVYALIPQKGLTKLVIVNHKMGTPTIEYPIEAESEDGERFTFTTDGKISTNHNQPILSFTPYDLVNGGFSQERPQPKIEVDQLIYVRHSDKRPWEMRYFSHFVGNSCYCFHDQQTSKESNYQSSSWDFYSIENPLLIK